MSNQNGGFNPWVFLFGLALGVMFILWPIGITGGLGEVAP